jgi:hypothetical protein
MEAMLMHMMATLDAIKNMVLLRPMKKPRCSTWRRKEVVKSAKASLSLLDGASKGSGKSKKTSKKA